MYLCRQHGAHQNLLPELVTTDKMSYKNFLRMDNDSFLLLLEKVTPLITHEDTTMRRSITPSERLSVTLRYLATGTLNL